MKVEISSVSEYSYLKLGYFKTDVLYICIKDRVVQCEL